MKVQGCTDVGLMRKDNFVIMGISGLGGSGKDTVINHILKKRNATVVHLRKPVEEELIKRHRKINNKSLREMATALRVKHGPAVMIRRSVKEIEKAFGNSDLVIINSIKSLDEVDFINNSLDYRFELVAVYASPVKRFRRLAKRGLKWDMKDYKSFSWRDRTELKWGLGSAMALSDHVIVNDGTINELNKGVDSLLKKIDSDSRRKD